MEDKKAYMDIRSHRWMSSDINELATALAKVQGVLEGAHKDGVNPHFKSQYATLASTWEACRKPLADNGLSVVQTFEIEPEGVVVITTLLHISGQFMSGRLFLKPQKNDPQGIGSAITYGRRYGLAAIVGISPEDDDGEAATRPKEQPKRTDKGKSSPTTTGGKKGKTDKKVDNTARFLDSMTKERIRIGDEAYFEILGGMGFIKTEEITDQLTKTKLWTETKKVADKEVE